MLIATSRPPTPRGARRPLFVLIGGATGVGKSTVAEGLARRLGIVRVVTTDMVREILRGALEPAHVRTLEVSTFEAGAEVAAPEDPERKDVRHGFRQQVEAVAGGVERLLRRAIVESADIIVEGVHLVPGTVRLPEEHEAVVVPFVLFVDDVERHRAYLMSRSEDTDRRPPDRYLARLEEIRLIQAEVIQRAEEEGVAMLRSTSIEGTVDAALEVVEQALTAAGTGPSDEFSPSTHDRTGCP